MMKFLELILLVQSSSNLIIKHLRSKYRLRVVSGVYILQNTMVVGGGVEWLIGKKKLKLRVWVKKMKKKGKGKKEKNGLKTHL